MAKQQHFALKFAEDVFIFVQLLMSLTKFSINLYILNKTNYFLMLPKIKKRLKSFVLEEEGKISKQSVLKIGSVLLLSILGSSSHVGSWSGGSGGGGGGGGGSGGGGSGGGATGCSGACGAAGGGEGCGCYSGCGAAAGGSCGGGGGGGGGGCPGETPAPSCGCGCF